MKFPAHDLNLLWLPEASERDSRVRRPLVPAYRVGELFQRGRLHWPIGTQYTYGPNGHGLTLFLGPIPQQLIHDVRFGEAEFALIVELPILVLAFRFGHSISWSDVPFCFHMQPACDRMIPPPELSDETRALLWVTLVGARDGLIHAQRGMTLAPEFTRVLHQSIREQAAKPFSPDDCLMAVRQLFVDRRDMDARLSLARSHTKGNR